ncbi:MAG: 3-dehydroquinate synthase, partial [Planctomycetaceae bacterium]
MTRHRAEGRATMTYETGPTRTEVRFAPSFVHRLYFTHDLLGDDRDVLAEVLPPPEGRPARVQFWMDEHVARAQPDLRHRLRAFASAYPGRIERAGHVQLAPGGEAIKNDIHILERMLKVFHAADLDRR